MYSTFLYIFKQINSTVLSFTVLSCELVNLIMFNNQY